MLGASASAARTGSEEISKYCGGVEMKQCKACPWRVGVQPDQDIPNGYCAAQHAALKCTIKPGLEGFFWDVSDHGLSRDACGPRAAVRGVVAQSAAWRRCEHCAADGGVQDP